MAAWRAMEKPPGGMSIKEAAWQVMPAAYKTASGGVGLANARQVMYAARPTILKLTGKEEIGDQYFIQTLLPDYIDEHPNTTADWDVVFDDRGSFIEPHTGHVVPLGTVEVRQYYGERPPDRPLASDHAAYGVNGRTDKPVSAYPVHREGRLLGAASTRPDRRTLRRRHHVHEGHERDSGPVAARPPAPADQVGAGVARLRCVGIL